MLGLSATLCLTLAYKDVNLILLRASVFGPRRFGLKEEELLLLVSLFRLGLFLRMSFGANLLSHRCG